LPLPESAFARQETFAQREFQDLVSAAFAIVGEIALQDMLDVVRMAQLMRDPDAAITNHVTISQGGAKETAQRVSAEFWQIKEKLELGRPRRFSQLAGTSQHP